MKTNKIDRLFYFFKIGLFRKYTLIFAYISGLMPHIFRGQDSSFMKDRDTVAYILKFPKFMRCHYHRKLPFFHFLTKQVFHHFRHDRIKTVEHFITEKVFCSGTKGKDKKCLTFHTF